MTAAEIGKHVGRSKSAICKFMSLEKARGDKAKREPDAVGQMKRYYVKGGGRYVEREKQADGTWKHLRSVTVSRKPGKTKPVGTVTTLKNGDQKIKTETGWQYVKKGRSTTPRTLNRPPKYQPGDIITKKIRGKNRQFQKQEDGTIKLLPIIETKVILKPKTINQMPKRKEPNPKNKAKKSLDASKNPDSFKIPETKQGYYVRIDSRTHVFKTNPNA